MTRKPLTQGDEDGFCGLYSTCNALNLLFPKMTTDDLSAVFKVIAWACKSMWPDIVWQGTTVEDVRAMLDAARTQLDCSFEWEQPFAHKKFHIFEEFKRELSWR